MTSTARAVWKFPLEIVNVQDVEMPAGSDIRHVGSQMDQICMWVEVDPDEPEREQRRLRIVGTGHQEIVPGDIFRGTAFVAGGTLVFHVYEVTEEITYREVGS